MTFEVDLLRKAYNRGRSKVRQFWLFGANEFQRTAMLHNAGLEEVADEVTRALRGDVDALAAKLEAVGEDEGDKLDLVAKELRALLDKHAPKPRGPKPTKGQR